MTKRRRPNRVLVQAAQASARPLRDRVARRARAFLRQLEVEGSELSVSLVSDAAIRRLNRTWRGKDKATDVLSFPAGELPPDTPGPVPLGDVVISIQTASRIARAEGRRTEAEVDRYLAHGLLHLLGFDHERGPREARRMAALEEALLGAGRRNPPPLTHATRDR